jgi:hypothetical protein
LINNDLDLLTIANCCCFKKRFRMGQFGFSKCSDIEVPQTGRFRNTDNNLTVYRKNVVVISLLGD